VFYRTVGNWNCNSLCPVHHFVFNISFRPRNLSKSKAILFTRATVKDPLNYSSMDTLIPEASSCKYLGIILRSDKWGGSSQLHGEKGLGGTTFRNANIKQG
jgi:hypothetical protein